VIILEKILEVDSSNGTLYSAKETSKRTGLSVDLLRLYEKEFNLEIPRTNGNHRRYTVEIIEKLTEIKKKIQEQNWTYKMVQQWLNGEELELEEPNVQSDIKKKLNNQEEMIKSLLEHNQKQEQFNQALIQRLDEQAKVITQLSSNLKQQQSYIESKLEKRDQLLLESIKKTQGEYKKRRGIFQRLFQK
jgi:DNA-binding transcriptional MerR regulator